VLSGGVQLLKAYSPSTIMEVWFKQAPEGSYHAMRILAESSDRLMVFKKWGAEGTKYSLFDGILVDDANTIPLLV
jgi:hypothetical protein